MDRSRSVEIQEGLQRERILPSSPHPPAKERGERVQWEEANGGREWSWRGDRSGKSFRERNPRLEPGRKKKKTLGRETKKLGVSATVKGLRKRNSN